MGIVAQRVLGRAATHGLDGVEEVLPTVPVRNASITLCLV